MPRPRHHGLCVALAILVAAIVAAPAAASTGLIYSVAGAGFFLRPSASIPPPTGDGGPAGLARLTFPTAVAATPDGGFLVAETERHRVRRVSSRGIITTIAGTGRGGFSGDGGPATRARLDFPTGVAQLPDGAEHRADVCEFLGVSLGALMVAVVLQTLQVALDARRGATSRATPTGRSSRVPARARCPSARSSTTPC